MQERRKLGGSRTFGWVAMALLYMIFGVKHIESVTPIGETANINAAMVSIFYDLPSPMVCFICKTPDGNKDVFETQGSRDECRRITHREYAITMGNVIQGEKLQIVCEGYGENELEYSKLAGDYEVEFAGSKGNLLYISKSVSTERKSSQSYSGDKENQFERIDRKDTYQEQIVEQSDVSIKGDEKMERVNEVDGEVQEQSLDAQRIQQPRSVSVLSVDGDRDEL